LISHSFSLRILSLLMIDNGKSKILGEMLDFIM
jgi:hypothetical protein